MVWKSWVEKLMNDEAGSGAGRGSCVRVELIASWNRREVELCVLWL